MELSTYPANVQRILSELIKRKVISSYSLTDKMFINYLQTLKLDEDYISKIYQSI